MAYPVTMADVQRALSPYLGERFVQQTALCAHAAEALRQYRPGRMTLAELTEDVRRVIFGELYAVLGVEMLLELENGTRLRIRLEDVRTLADAAVGALLDTMPSAELPLSELRAHAMQHQSLAAMRQILRRYARQLHLQELELFRRILQENDPRGSV